MALTDYMGDAPGFMSYRRAPQMNVTNIPQRQKPVQTQFQGQEFDIDLEANPGDKQYLADQNMAFNAGVQDLYKQYGGEMDWVIADPKYKELAQGTRWEVYDRQAAEQNKVNTDKRLKDLSSMDSGQHNSDYELTLQNGIYVPTIGERGGFLTKGEYTQHVVANPQLTQRDDGSVGIKHTEFDYGTGNQKSFHQVLDNIYAGDSRIGVNSSGTNQTDAQDTSETANLKYAVSFFHNEGYKSANNYQQINDATQYLIDYGFDDSQKYYLWQSFYKDVEEGKPFKTPRMDENGDYARRSDGSVIMDEQYVSPEDLQDPAKMSTLFNTYVTDRIIDYSEKFKKKDSETWRTDKSSTENIDANGNVIQPPADLRRWEGVTQGFYPKNNAISENVYTRGSNADIAGGVIYNQSQGTFNVLDNTNFPAGMDQASAAIVGKGINEFGGNIFVGGRWVNVGDMGLEGDIPIGNVLNVREIPMYSTNADGTVSTMSEADAKGDGAKVTWGATVRLYADDDSGLFEKFVFVNPATGQSESMFFGDDVNPAAATQGIAGFTDRTSVSAKGYNIHGDESPEGNEWFDPNDQNVQYIDIVIPIEDGMLNFDEYQVGETRAAESEQIQTKGSVIGTLQGLGNEQNNTAAGKQIGTFQ